MRIKLLIIIVAGGIILIAGALALSRSGPPQPTAEEEAVLAALKNVQEGYGSRVTYEQYAALVDTAAQKIDQLKKAGAQSTCFMTAAERSCSSFEMGEKAWRAKDAAADENRRIDMETTLSFTIGFASISLAKANECFYK